MLIILSLHAPNKICPKGQFCISGGREERFAPYRGRTGLISRRTQRSFWIYSSFRISRRETINCLTPSTQQNMPKRAILYKRRARDSNSRSSYPDAAFPGRCTRPLCEPSSSDRGDYSKYLPISKGESLFDIAKNSDRVGDSLSFTVGDPCLLLD